ncbi:uncharacterized protein LOC128993188 [Macrosteles quadrilineatus]|uniref:uncharacterized protein LOC128993188 n=1 Tax=Macrosteles quadrilineatus TaxID=74068 RepID=UPI0023E1C758|nr:uncharacterized protein LOC128993188 [Macrosteles quadrilineatus]
MKVESKQLESSVTLRGESLPTQDDRHVKQEGLLPQGPRKYWEISAHCNTIRLPQSKPDISFDNPSSNYYYQLLTSAAPNRQEAKLITQAQLQGLARLNRSKMQVRNFVFPVQLMKMKHMDPQSRQKIIEELCKYFSLQRGLYNIVLEQAELKFQDLCCLLVAIAGSCRVKSLYLWHVLNTCEKPFKGPLQSDIVLDDLPRVPYTYNPGGRKYLRELGKAKVHKLEREISKETKKVVISDESLTKKSDLRKVPSYTNKSGESSYNLRVQQSPNVDSHDFMVRTHSRVDSNNLFTQHQKEGMKNKSTLNRSVSYADQNTFSQTESYNSQTTGLYSDNILKQNVNENKSVNNSLKLNQSISFAQQSTSQQESYHKHFTARKLPQSVY